MKLHQTAEQPLAAATPKLSYRGTVLRLQIENAACCVHSAGAAGSLYVNSFTTEQNFRDGMSAVVNSRHIALPVANGA
jgi:hypothetical protein